MMLKLLDFCPPVDSALLHEFWSDAYQAWMGAPIHQNGWLNQCKLIDDLLDLASTGPVNLDLR